MTDQTEEQLQLSDAELIRLRELLTADARRQWLVSYIEGAAR